MDHGKEFYLSLYVQEKLRIGRGDKTIVPYVQTTSTCNHIIERIWVELNQRVTYPIKRIVQTMDDCRSINMDCPVTKFCVSTILCQVSEVGMERMIQAWNNHPIPHCGVPNELQVRALHTSSIQPSEIPSSNAAVTLYTNQGGRLRDPTVFGNDPLESDVELCRIRNDRWLTKCGMNVGQIFSEVITGNGQVLENSILDFIDITSELANQ